MAGAVRRTPDPDVVAVPERSYDPWVLARVDLLEAAGDVPCLTVAPAGGRQHGVDRPDVRADPVGERHEEPRAQRRRVVARRQLVAHPLVVDVGGHDEVRRERHDRGGAAVLGHDVDRPVGLGVAALGRGAKDVDQAHRRDGKASGHADVIRTEVVRNRS
jgi:hypothetical protein